MEKNEVLDMSLASLENGVEIYRVVPEEGVTVGVRFNGRRVDGNIIYCVTGNIYGPKNSEGEYPQIDVYEDRIFHEASEAIKLFLKMCYESIGPFGS